MNNLESLDLQGCEGIDDNALNHLSLCHKDYQKQIFNHAHNENDIEEVCCFAAKTLNHSNQCTSHFYGNSCKESYEEKHLKRLNLSGCYKITDVGLGHLVKSRFVKEMTHLDVSGCFRLTRVGLDIVVRNNDSLRPENLSYCDEIFDGPYSTSANGCNNLCHPMRACCRKGF